ncbi:MULTISPECIES: DUF2188 domain-containing protein [Mycobacterium simiae complex]|uniref:Uncharacterized protein n=2 Tax=Mycobacterium triplex TaxID=47839 RepID=A0A024K654_9MYCO|nr:MULTISPECIES: DUF2188 domain-containing protein [Mycobacterium simiae complex]CDO91386.1 hypothetical protein BN973_05794 [Mycobacterium triplex]
MPLLTAPRREEHDAARRLAERSGGGEVRDHRKDNNQIRNADTVGKTPVPPEGLSLAPGQHAGRPTRELLPQI